MKNQDNQNLVGLCEPRISHIPVKQVDFDELADLQVLSPEIFYRGDFPHKDLPIGPRYNS